MTTLPTRFNGAANPGFGIHARGAPPIFDNFAPDNGFYVQNFAPPAEYQEHNPGLSGGTYSRSIAYDVNQDGRSTHTKNPQPKLDKAGVVIRLLGIKEPQSKYIVDNVVADPKAILAKFQNHVHEAAGAPAGREEEYFGSYFQIGLANLKIFKNKALWAYFLLGNFGPSGCNLLDFLTEEIKEKDLRVNHIVTALQNLSDTIAGVFHHLEYSTLCDAVIHNVKTTWGFLHSKAQIVLYLAERTLTAFFKTLREVHANEHGGYLRILGPHDDPSEPGSMGVMSVMYSSVAETTEVDANVNMQWEKSRAYANSTLGGAGASSNFPSPDDDDTSDEEEAKKVKKRRQSSVKRTKTSDRVKESSQKNDYHEHSQKDVSDEICVSHTLSQFGFATKCSGGADGTCSRDHPRVSSKTDKKILERLRAVPPLKNPALQHALDELLTSKRVEPVKDTPPPASSRAGTTVVTRGKRTRG